MKGSILGNRALRVACACALALGIAPAAAWGVADGEQPASDVDALQGVVEDMPQEDSARDTEPKIEGAGKDSCARTDSEGTQGVNEEPCDDIPSNDSEFTAAQKDAQQSADADGSAARAEDPAAPSSTPSNKGGRALCRNAAQTASATRSGEYGLSASTQSVIVRTYLCPICGQDVYHAEPNSNLIEYTVSLPETADPSDYYVEIRNSEGISFDSSSIENEGTGALTCTATVSGSYNIVLLRSFGPSETPDSADTAPLATVPLEVVVEESSENATLTPIADKTLIVSNSEEANFVDVIGAFPGTDSGVFAPNGAGAAVLWDHLDGDWIASITSSDPAIVRIDAEESNDGSETAYWQALGLKPGIATITVSVKDGRTFSNTITVVEPSSFDPSQLAFAEEAIETFVGENPYFEDFSNDFVTVGANENYQGRPWAIISQNKDVLRTLYASTDEVDDIGAYANGNRITALKPGTATLELYYINYDNWELTLVDTMTVTVSAKTEATGSTSANSDFSGHIVSSNEATDTLVKDGGLFLIAADKDTAELNAGQKSALREAQSAESATKVTPIDLSLADSAGNIFADYDNDAYLFTVRLKLEGDLAGFNPTTMSVYYLADDGSPEPATCWVQDGFLYIVTDHFSQYAVLGNEATTPDNNGSQGSGSTNSGSQGDNMTNVSDKGTESSTGTSVSDKDASRTKDKDSATAKDPTPLAQTGDSLLPLAATLGVATILGAAGLAVARRRMSRW